MRTVPVSKVAAFVENVFGVPFKGSHITEVRCEPMTVTLTGYVAEGDGLKVDDDGELATYTLTAFVDRSEEAR